MSIRVLCLMVFLSALIGLLCSCAKQPEKKRESVQEKIVFNQIPKSPIVFLSTQLNPVEEAAKMRNDILAFFPGQVEFRPNDNNYIFEQIAVVQKKKPEVSVLVGALHGDLMKLYEDKSLMPVDALYSSMTDRTVSANLINLSKFDGVSSYYVPWMQASFVMVANKKALQYLPKGASLQSLTYDQFTEWAAAVKKKTGTARLGFPVGEKGLMHRFLQGYLYPSFTGSTLLKFRNADAKTMWAYMIELWKSVDPGSLTYSSMDEPLLIGDVWIAWDHTARLVKVFEEKPDDFVAFPAPIGPRGRGFMTVISGLAIPKNAVDTDSIGLLVDFLTMPSVQSRMLLETGFFPVLELAKGDDSAGKMNELSKAVSGQSNAKNSIPTLLPVGLGDSGGTYNNIFMLTFSQIVLEGKNIDTVLNTSAGELQTIIDKQNLKCWLPDVSSERPCQIE